MCLLSVDWSSNVVGHFKEVTSEMSDQPEVDGLGGKITVTTTSSAKADNVHWRSCV